MEWIIWFEPSENMKPLWTTPLSSCVKKTWHGRAFCFAWMVRLKPFSTGWSGRYCITTSIKEIFPGSSWSRRQMVSESRFQTRKSNTKLPTKVGLKPSNFFSFALRVWPTFQKLDGQRPGHPQANMMFSASLCSGHPPCRTAQAYGSAVIARPPQTSDCDTSKVG